MKTGMKGMREYWRYEVRRDNDLSETSPFMMFRTRKAAIDFCIKNKNHQIVICKILTTSKKFYDHPYIDSGK